MMTTLPFTTDNLGVIQEFLDETRKRLSEGVEIIFTTKSNLELQDLTLAYDIELTDIEDAIEKLTPANYFRGIDPSGNADFNVCAFCTTIGKDCMEIYLKYGLEVNGLQVLLFSNHIPNYPMKKPFKN